MAKALCLSVNDTYNTLKKTSTETNRLAQIGEILEVIFITILAKKQGITNPIDPQIEELTSKTKF